MDLPAENAQLNVSRCRAELVLENLLRNACEAIRGRESRTAGGARLDGANAAVAKMIDAAAVEGEGQVLGEGEGQVLGEGKGQVLGEGEGQVLGEGEGQVLGEGEGQVLGEGEGAVDGVGSVLIQVEREADRVRVRVIDDGPGIPAELREQVMKPFFTTKHRGLGLGLSLCRSVVERSGGYLHLDRCPEGGTVATVEFLTVEESEREQT